MCMLYLLIHLFLLQCVCGMPYFSNLTACPKSTPQPDIKDNELAGKWYLASLLFDEAINDMGVIEEEAACMKADIKKVNSTYFIQVWAIHSSTKKTGMVFELPTSVDKPGSWTVLSPLGVPLYVTVVSAFPQSHMILLFCAGDTQRMYMWTAVLTRKKKLSSFDLVKLSSSITQHGFGSSTGQLVTWHYC